MCSVSLGSLHSEFVVSCTSNSLPILTRMLSVRAFFLSRVPILKGHLPASLAAKGPSSQCLLQSHSHHSVSTSESDTLVTLMEGRAFCWDENDPPAKAFDVQAFSDLLAHRTLRSIL